MTPSEQKVLRDCVDAMQLSLHSSTAHEHAIAAEKLLNNHLVDSHEMLGVDNVQLEALQLEHQALQRGFQDVVRALADKHVAPIGFNDVTTVTIDNDKWIVPLGLAKSIEDLQEQTKILVGEMSTADKLNRLADVMEECGIEIMTGAEPTTLQIDGKVVRVSIGRRNLWLRQSDIRRAAGEVEG